jgi:hypothetical protein
MHDGSFENFMQRVDMWETKPSPIVARSGTKYPQSQAIAKKRDDCVASMQTRGAIAINAAFFGAQILHVKKFQH